jgi:hypothetical protein
MNKTKLTFAHLSENNEKEPNNYNNIYCVAIH